MTSKEARQPEGDMVRAFMQGCLLSFCHAGLNGVLRVESVEQGVDDDGNYLPYFVVVTESGLRIRVGLEAL